MKAFWHPPPRKREILYPPGGNRKTLAPPHPPTPPAGPGQMLTSSGFRRQISDWFLDRFWWHFPSQIGSPEPPKLIKNRCKVVLYPRFHFLTDFSSIFAPNFDPKILKSQAPAAGRARSFKDRLSKFTSMLGQILMAICLRFSLKNRSIRTLTRYCYYCHYRYS